MKKDISVDEMKNLLVDLGVQVRQADLCGSCRAITRKMNEGYLVLVERTLCFDAVISSLKHELMHILLGHLDDDTKTVDEKEREAEEYSKNIFFYHVN